MKSTENLDVNSIIIIAGPTASGKTESAIALSRRIPLEIISADSRQVYRYLSIGTAKPTLEQQQCVKHHLIDIINPDQIFNAGHFISLAEKAIKNIISRNKIPLVVGGTGLYIKALMDGLSPLPEKNTAIRNKLTQELKQFGVQHLFNQLKHCDPDTAAAIDAANPARIIRALEVFMITGKGMSYHHSIKPKLSPYTYKLFYLGPSKEVLMNHIARRTKKMIQSGIIEETKQLLASGWDESCPAFSSVGYKDVLAYLKGMFDIKKLEESIITGTWQYAKRQITWFKKDKRIIPVNQYNIIEIIENTLKN